MLLFFDRRQKHPQCILDHICIKANDLSQNKKQILHKLQDKDLYTSGQCMQGLLGIQYWQHTLVYIQYRGFQCSLEYMNRKLL